MRCHSSRNNCRKQSSPKSFDIGAKYTWFANQNSGFFGPKCHLSGLCSHRLMGAAPSVCRAVLLVPWSATPLLGSSQCLFQKPVGVETCQNVNLEVHALLMGNAERHVLNIYNPNHDVFTRQPKRTVRFTGPFRMQTSALLPVPPTLPSKWFSPLTRFIT